MTKDASHREYITFDPSLGYPAKSGLFYECKRCGDVLESSPAKNLHCSCRNIMIDADFGRIAIQDHAKIALFKCR